MQTVAATYVHLEDAAQAVKELEEFLPPDRIHLLTPASTEEEALSIPRTSDMPPVGRAIGGVLGAALVAGLVVAIPGLGALLIPLAALAAIAGGLAGYLIGDRIDRASFRGLPVDELFVYEDAVRQGRFVEIAMVRGRREEQRVRRVFEETGAETLDAARKSWWLGIRDAEAAHYHAEGQGEFEKDDPIYRQGYEAALSSSQWGEPYDHVLEELRLRYPLVHQEAAFRLGHEHGTNFLRERARADDANARR